VTSEYNNPSTAEIRALLDRTSCLLFDFDGPLCRLFAGSPAPRIAQSMRDHLAARGAALTDPELLASGDPLRILLAALDPRRTRALEALLTEAEEAAALSAEPTLYAGDFVRIMAARGRQLAVTTNNAPSAAEVYLKIHGLDAPFGDRIFGRSPHDPHLMKPHPDCLRRALDALAAAPEECLMIGDSPADAQAAHDADVPFLGYAATPAQAHRLRRAALRHTAPEDVVIVVGMSDLATAAGDLAPLNR
jgi:HAD superfamily hydrolase (TIGR01509 family)